MHECCGRVGQGVVQFAVGVRDGHAYALKFYVVQESFDAERELYGNGAIAQFLPRLEAMEANADGALVDKRGHALPSCLAMEKGESLDEWSRRAKPDLFMAVTVRAACCGSAQPGRRSRSVLRWFTSRRTQTAAAETQRMTFCAGRLADAPAVM